MNVYRKHKREKIIQGYRKSTPTLETYIVRNVEETVGKKNSLDGYRPSSSDHRDRHRHRQRSAGVGEGLHCKE